MGAGRRRSLAWWIRWSAVQAVLVFLLLEVALRIYNPIPFRVRGDEVVLPIKQVYRFTNGATRKLEPTTVHTKNSLGFRGPDLPADFSSRLTIVALGGSTTEGLFLSDGRTWPEQLSVRLAETFPDVWVNNAGMDGQTTFGHIVLLRSVVARLRPTLAVFLIGLNDLGHTAANTFDDGLVPQNSGLRRLANAAAEWSDVVNVTWNLTRAARARNRGLGHSEVDLRKAVHLVLPDEAMAETEATYRAVLPGYADRLRQIADLARATGIEPVWLTQPALYGDAVDPTTGVDLTYVQVNGRGNGHLEWRLLENQNAVTRQVATEKGVFLVDLAAEMPKDSRYYYDFVHFTNDGAAHVAEIVAGHLIPHVKR